MTTDTRYTDNWQPDPADLCQGLAVRADLARRRLAHMEDPVEFIEGRLDESVWSKQREIIQSVQVNRHTAVPSCHGTGKSFIAARTVAHFLSSNPPDSVFVVTTAPTNAQIRAILWREIRTAHRKGNLPGRVNQTEWHFQDIAGFGRKPQDNNQDAFQGIHQDKVLIVLDEACGIPPDLWEAAETLMTNEDCRMLAIGNPTDPHSEFAKKCQPGSGWNVIHIGYEDTPNFTGEDVPAEVSKNLISQVWVDERRTEWGEGSAMFIARVLGVFPEDTSDGVIPLSSIRAVQYDPEDRPPLPTHDETDLMSGITETIADFDVCLGVDVGAGGDPTVIRERAGIRAGRQWSASTPDSEDVISLVLRAAAETLPDRINVDVIGVGFGIVGTLRKLVREAAPGDLLYGVRVDGVNVGAAPMDKKRFPKLRDEMWWVVGRELIQSGAMDLTDVDDATIAQLISPTYGPDIGGRVKIEAKDDTRKRIGRSPDNADALLLAFYVGAPVWTVD